MAWYKLNLPLRADELDAKIDQYRGMVQQAIGRLGGADTRARVYCARRAGDAEIFLEIEGRQPSWFMMKLMRCDAIDAPGAPDLELLGEVAEGAATLRDPVRPT